jgi:GNAT superfamily N-acetyltransferase
MPQLDVVIADEAEEYVCYAGMWWTPENHLAYMEPLCTIPEYRHKGLASAALTEMYRRKKALGATHMTGGLDGFYKKIGYLSTVKWTFWEKQ